MTGAQLLVFAGIIWLVVRHARRGRAKAARAEQRSTAPQRPAAKRARR